MDRPTVQQRWVSLGPNEILRDLVLGIRAASYFKLQEPGHWPPHQHLDFELIMIVEGRYEATVNGVSVRLDAGGILFVQPEDWHEDHCARGIEFCALHGSLTSAGRSMPLLDAAAPIDARVLHGCGDLVADALAALRTEPESAVASARQNAQLQLVVWSVVDRIPAEHHAGRLLGDDPDAHQRAEIRRAFEHHCTAPVGMARIATELGMSERQLRARCRQLFGLSPAKAFTAHRLARAREHILHTTMSIAEIARYFGFATPFHFSRLFKACYGIAPSHLREQRRDAGTDRGSPE